MENLTFWQPVIEVITNAGAVSIPLVVVCGIVGRAYNALVGMVTGERRVRF